MSQIIARDIVLGKPGQFRLQFHPNHTHLGKTASQKQSDNPAAGAQIEYWRVSVKTRRDKIGQEKGIEGKPVAMPRLVQH